MNGELKELALQSISFHLSNFVNEITTEEHFFCQAFTVIESEKLPTVIFIYKRLMANKSVLPHVC
jgi:hypothetical protein